MLSQTKVLKSQEEEALLSCFNSKDIQGILKHARDPKVFRILPKIVEDFSTSSNIDISAQSFLVQLLLQLVKNFGILAAMILETPSVCELLAAYFNKSGGDQQVLQLLQTSLQLFLTGSHQEILPNLCRLYKRLTNTDAIPDGASSKTAFLELFNNIQHILRFRRSMAATEEAKGVLSVMIKTLFSEIDFNNSGISEIEKDYLKTSRDMFQGILDQFEKEREEARKARQHKEIYKSNLEALPKEYHLFNRTSFTYGENILFEENEEREYKEYGLPLRESVEKALSKTICSFLNNKGGRIYIGISDNKIVKGIKLTRLQKEELQQTINKCISLFEPDILPLDLVQMCFLPVMFPQTSKPIPGLYVVKIIVQQGDPSCLYSISNDLLRCYVRSEDRSEFLAAKELKKAIINRFCQPLPKVPAEAFLDPKPEPGVDVEEFPKNLVKDERKEDYDEKGEGLGESGCESQTYRSNNSTKRQLVQNGSNFRDSLLSAHESTVSETTMPYSVGQDLDQGDLDPNSFLKSTLKEDMSILGSKTTSDFEQVEERNEDSSLKDSSSRLKMLEEGNLSALALNQQSLKKKSPNKITRERTNTNNSLQAKKPVDTSKESTPVVAQNLRNSHEDSKKLTTAEPKLPIKGQPTQEGQKGYYSNLLEAMNNVQINGKNLVKVYEVFMDGLPLTWTQEEFDKFVANLGCKSIFFSRMFKKDTGYCNGKAFFNFTDQEEANKFIATYDKSTMFGKVITAKFK